MPNRTAAQSARLSRVSREGHLQYNERVQQQMACAPQSQAEAYKNAWERGLISWSEIPAKFRQ